MIKAVFLDIDGTLLNTNNEISKRNIDIIKYIQKKYNIYFFLATGRPIQDLVHYYKILNLYTPMICMNGSYIVNFNLKKIKEETIPLNIIKNFKKECNNYYYHYLISTIFYIGSNIITDEIKNINIEIYNSTNNLKIISFTEIIKYLEKTNNTLNKIGIISNNKKIIENIYIYLKYKFKNILNIYRSQSNFIEVVNYNVSKARAIDYLNKKFFSFKKENIMAIGDSDNDISMIKFVGLGIAMGNSKEYIKKYAKYVTLNNNDDGVAYALEKFIINKNLLK